MYNPSQTTLAFDIYGTLIDTNGVLAALRDIVGGDAEAISQTWRTKQLEYAFRRGLMQRYADFAVCTRQALEYACAHHKASLNTEQTEHLLQTYQELPSFDEVTASLAQLKAAGYRLFAFSNGSAEAIATLLAHNEISDYFEGIVSCADVETFKPAPAVYQHLLSQTGSAPAATWLVSSNPFDVIGAVASGLQSAWVKRSEAAIFDPMGIEPTTIVSSIDKLHASIASAP